MLFKDLPRTHAFTWHGENWIKVNDQLLDRGTAYPGPDELVIDLGQPDFFWFEEDKRVYEPATVEEEVIKHIICPHCDKRASGYSGQELFGPWYCNECGHSFDGKVVDGKVMLCKGDVIMSKCVVELSVPNSDIRIYVEGMHFSNREFGSNDEYYYNEHTCPTNYLRHIIRVQNGDDDDPHGVFPYVRTIDWDKFQASRICTLQ